MKFRHLTIVSITVPIIAVTGLAYWVWWGLIHLPSPAISTVIQDRNGIRIGEVLSSEWTRNIPIRFNQIPPIFIRGLITLEDRSFYEHFGISPTGLVRSGWNNIQTSLWNTTGPAQGGSTITMGLARNILWINRPRTIPHKIEEMLFALRIEWHMSKDTILEEYVNRAHYSRLSVWIGAASEAYLGKTVENLTDAESIALLSLLRNPTAYDPISEPETFSIRYENVLRTLEKEGVISESERSRYLAEPIQWVRTKDRLPYVTDMLKHRRDTSLPDNELARIDQVLMEGGVLRTSVDLWLTDRIRSGAEEVRTWLRNRNVSDYGILVIDRETLRLRVLIGWTDYQGSENGQVNSIFAERQVGSTIKPFTYLLALTKTGRNMNDLILDAPVSFPTSEWNPYEPKNYSLRYRWNISLAEALAGSVNIPAVKLAAEVGVDTLLGFLRSLWITSLNQDAEHYGLALTLGVGEVRLWELLRAYTIFSEDGHLCEFSILEEGTGKNCVEKVDQLAIRSIVETLSDARFKSEEFPLGSALDFWIWHVFVKTGTSRNFRDNYAIGFTRNYLIAVWTGNKDGSNMRWVSWASGAGEIFAGVVDTLWERNLILNRTNQDRNTENTQTSAYFEWERGSADLRLKRDSADLVGSGWNRNTGITITSPLPWSTYLLDPSIPKEKQNIILRYWSDRPLENVRLTITQNTNRLADQKTDMPHPASNSRWEPSLTREIGSDHQIPIGTLKPWSYTIKVAGVVWSGTTISTESIFHVSDGEDVNSAE